MNWQEMFHIVEKWSGGRHFYIIVKHGDAWSFNFHQYRERRYAKIAAIKIYQGIERQIEKELLGEQA